MSSRKPTTVLNPVKDTKHKYLDTEIIEIQDKYNNLTLSFGKYKEKTLHQVFQEDPSYLLWLKKEFKKDEDNLTPTKKAIIKYTTALLDNKI